MTSVLDNAELQCRECRRWFPSSEACVVATLNPQTGRLEETWWCCQDCKGQGSLIDQARKAQKDAE